MILVCDTREQKMLDFSGIEGIEKIEELALAFGDYTAIVHERPVPIVFERKGISDLFGTMTSGYERFKKEMERAKTSNMKLIIIVEGSYTDVWNGIEHSQFSGESMIKKLHMLQVRHDIETVYCESRRVMARYIAGLFSAVERNWTKENSKTISNLGVNPSASYKEPTASFGPPRCRRHRGRVLGVTRSERGRSPLIVGLGDTP